MSDFGEALFDLLPMHCSLQSPNNPGRKVLDNSIGEWFDHHDVLTFYDNLFLDTATGVYLDLFGKDYGVTRQVDESDEDYRVRIIQEKNDHLTPEYLLELYGLTLYSYVSSFYAMDNDLTSDNPYLTNGNYMAIDTGGVKNILDKKFVLTNEILWISLDTPLDFIYNVNDEDVYLNYLNIYHTNRVDNYFNGSTSIKKVKLTLTKVVSAQRLFEYCAGLTEVELYIPNAKHIQGLFNGCTGLDKLVADLSSARIHPSFINSIFYGVDCTYVNLTVAENLKGTFTSLCKDRMPSLETLIVNGEEVDLS